MNRHNRVLLPTVVACILALTGEAQERPELSLNLGYFNNNDRFQYLVASAKTRVNGKFQPRDSVPVRFFISNESAGNLLGKAMTNARGEAVLFLTPAAKTEWDKSPKQSFIAVADSSPAYGAATTNVDIVKARIELDTADGRNIVATVLEQKPAGWTPVENVDVILAVKRMGSNLNVSETPVYTTDEAGKVSTEFKPVNLPGDDSGNIVLVARLDASDLYGTVSKEKKLPWGIARATVSNFDKRTLYARRGLAPIWLGFIAGSITLAVWGVIVFLVFQLRKIRQIGIHSPSFPK